MSWTVSGLAEALAVEFGKEWDDTDNQAQIMAWVNDAYKTVVNYYDWWWLTTQEDIAAVLNATSITLANTAVQPTSVSIVSPTFLEIPLIDITGINGIDTTVTGRPRCCWIKSFLLDQVTLGIYPTLDGSYTFRVFETIRPADLSDETTIPVPTEFIPVIKDYVRYLALTREGDYYGAKFRREDAYGQLDLMKKKTGIPKARRTSFAVSDVKEQRFPMLPRLPGNYPEW